MQNRTSEMTGRNCEFTAKICEMTGRNCEITDRQAEVKPVPQKTYRSKHTTAKWRGSDAQQQQHLYENIHIKVSFKLNKYHKLIKKQTSLSFVISMGVFGLFFVFFLLIIPCFAMSYVKTCVLKVGCTS
jgi:hypothetical protein